MSQKKIKQYNSGFKLKVVLEVLREEQSINEIASKYKVFPRSIYNWKKEFLENAELAFSKEHLLKDYKKQIQDLKDEQEELFKEIGKLLSKLNWAEKKIKDLNLE